MVTRVEIDRTDSNNRLTTTFDHDSRSNLVWMVNAEGNPSRWTFDGLSRMTKREVALSVGDPIEDFTSAQVVEWGFDTNSRLTSHKDDHAYETTWTYDALDRPVTQTYPDSTYISLTYDANDNVTQTIDAAGNDIDDTFDSLNRRTARNITRASGFIDTTAESFEYDALNRLTEAEDNDYRVSFTYGVLGLSSTPYTEVQEYATGSAYTKTVTTTYGSTGQLATLEYPSGLDLSYSYNDIGALSSISDGTNTIASFAYVGTRMKTITFQNGTTQTNTFGGFREDLTTVHHETSTPSTILRLDYGYNDVHDRTYERYGASGSSGDGFAYDMARRLTTAWMGSSTPSNPSGAQYVSKIEYNMDDDGNRTSVVVTPYGQSAQTTNYTHNTLHQYTAVGGTGHYYDGNGNLDDDGNLTYEYSYRNLICAVKDGETTVATYRYDALGRRVEKDVEEGVFERYVYAGLETIATYGASNAWKQDFVFGQGIDQILMLEQADVLDADEDENTSETTRSFYHRNALGSVMAITEMDEDVAVSYRYDPYGAVTITRGGQTQQTDPLGQHWTFTARFYDEESGLYYYRARDYSPTSGRFVERDPLAYLPGPCLYEYVRSHPTCQTDPLGLEGECPSPERALQDARDAMRACPCLPVARCRECCRAASERGVEAVNDVLQGALDWCREHHHGDYVFWMKMQRQVEATTTALQAVKLTSTFAAVATLVVAKWDPTALIDAAYEFIKVFTEEATGASDTLGSALTGWGKYIARINNTYIACVDGAVNRQRRAYSKLADALTKCLRKCGGKRVEK